MDDFHDNRVSADAEAGGREYLEYLADLLGELQQLAERQGCRKLSRMLAISHAEARREAYRRS